MTEASKHVRSRSNSLWQSKRMAQLKSELQKQSARQREFTSAASLAFSQAEQLANSPPYNGLDLAPPLALHLYAKAAYWAVVSEACALCQQYHPAPNDEFVPPATFEEALALTEIKLDDLGVQPERIEPIFSLIDQININDLIAQPARNPELEVALIRLSQQLVGRADRAARGVQEIWFQRLFRVGFPLALLLLFTGLASFMQARARLDDETMFPWRASSASGERGCESPRQGCEQDHFFFHTKLEKEPWIEFDVSRLNTVSQISIQNRTDCQGCSLRAVPLIIETSDDGSSWNTVARRDADFVTWTAHLPKTSTRFIRLRVLKRTPFHLKQVQITR